MAILVNSGRHAMAAALMAKSFYLAWGSGNAGWDSSPVNPSITDTALVAEVGRHIVTVAEYCTPDNAGSIVVPNGKFTVSGTPTNNIHLLFNFDFADSVDAIIREIGVFSDSTIVSGLPGGQLYFTPAQVLTQGKLVLLERIPKITRTALVRQTFEFVLTI